MSNNLESLQAELSELENSITTQGDEAATETKNDLEEDQQPTAEASEDYESEETTNDEGQWFVPGKFKTADDLRRSYENLQSHATRQSQELAQLRRGTTQPTEAPDVNEEEIVKFAEAVKKNPIEAIKGLFREEEARKSEIARENSYYQELETKLSDKEFVSLAPEMRNIIAEVHNKSPIVGNYLNNSKDPVILELLYTMAKARQGNSAEISKAVRKGEKQALNKKRASIEGASSSKGQSTKDPYDMSLEELEDEIANGNF